MKMKIKGMAPFELLGNLALIEITQETRGGVYTKIPGWLMLLAAEGIHDVIFVIKSSHPNKDTIRHMVSLSKQFISNINVRLLIDTQ